MGAQSYPIVALGRACGVHRFVGCIVNGGGVLRMC